MESPILNNITLFSFITHLPLLLSTSLTLYFLYLSVYHPINIKVFLNNKKFLSVLFSSIILNFSFYPNIYTFCLVLLLQSILIYFSVFINCELKYDLYSFFCFLVNWCLSCSFIFCIQNLPNILSKPIFIENLTTYSFYKYIILLCFIFSGILLYSTISFFFPTVLKNSTYRFIFLIPHLKENIRTILETITFLNEFLSNLIDSLYASKKAINLFFFLNFFLITFVRILQGTFLFSFVFLHTDLRLNFCLLPFSFLSWILSFLDYHFFKYIEENFDYVKSLLIVTLKDNQALVSTDLQLVQPSILAFDLTPRAYSENYGVNDLPYLSKSWIILSHIFNTYKIYRNYLWYISITISSIRVLCWLKIIYFFIVFNNYSIFSITSILTKGSRLYTNPAAAYATKAYYVKVQRQKALEQDSEGAYKAGHPVGVDENITNHKGYWSFQYALTHGLGSTKNPSYPLHKTQDINGPNPQGQRFITPATPTYIDPKDLHNAVVNSESFFKQDEVRSNLGKHYHKDPDSENT